MRSDEDLLAEFGAVESVVQAEGFRPYREILAEVMRRLGERWGFEPTEDDLRALADELPNWPVFEDTRSALARLQERYKLAIVSNIDDDLFAGTNRRLGIEFDEVVTAQQVGSYKPARSHFDEVLRRLDLDTDRVIHVAQSLFHDIAPARAMGWRTLWVNRRAGKVGSGATPPSEATPDHAVDDLTGVAELLLGPREETARP